MSKVDRSDYAYLEGGSPSQLVRNASVEVRLGFVRKVYGILTAQLMLTVVIAAPLAMMSPVSLAHLSFLLPLSSVMTLVTLCCMSCGAAKSYPTNYILLGIFTFFEAILVGFTSACYSHGSVLMAFAATAVIFMGLTFYACTTKSDFTGMGPFLFGLLMAMCIAGLALSLMSMMGIYCPMMLKLYACGGIVLFTFYIIVDTQRILGELGGHKHAFSVDDYVFAALTLYLDIINLFLYILEVFGKQK